MGDIARITQFAADGGSDVAVAAAIAGGSGTGSMADPAGLSNFSSGTSTLKVTWQKPRFPDGTVIAGLTHTFGVQCAATGDGIGNNQRQIEYTATSIPAVIDNGDGTLSITLSVGADKTNDLPDFIDAVDIVSYYLVPIAATADGQRNGEELWLLDPQ